MASKKISLGPLTRSGLRDKDGQWSKDESNQLVNNIGKQKIDYSLVKINGRTERECESRVQNIGFYNFLNLMKAMSNANENIPLGRVQKRQSKYRNRDRQKASKPDISTTRQLFKEHKEEILETNLQNKLSGQCTALEDNQKAIKKNSGAGDILSNEERRINRDEPKKPLDALGFLIQQEVHIRKVRLAKKVYERLTSEDVSEVENVDQSNATMRKRQEATSKLQTSQSTEKPEPTRIPKVPYNYYKLFIYPTWGRFAKKTYLLLDSKHKKRIRKDHELMYDRYCKQKATYIESLSKDEEKVFQTNIMAEEGNDSSDPDDD